MKYASVSIDMEVTTYVESEAEWAAEIPDSLIDAWKADKDKLLKTEEIINHLLEQANTVYQERMHHMTPKERRELSYKKAMLKFSEFEKAING